MNPKVSHLENLNLGVNEERKRKDTEPTSKWYLLKRKKKGTLK